MTFWNLSKKKQKSLTSSSSSSTNNDDVDCCIVNDANESTLDNTTHYSSSSNNDNESVVVVSSSSSEEDKEEDEKIKTTTTAITKTKTTKTTTTTSNKQSDHEKQGATPRIPLALQDVFLASNRGEEVNVPPPDNVGNKVFLVQNMIRRMSKRSSTMKNNKKNKNKKNKKNKKSKKKIMAIVNDVFDASNTENGSLSMSFSTTSSQSIIDVLNSSTKSVLGNKKAINRNSNTDLSPQEHLESLLLSSSCTKTSNSKNKSNNKISSLRTGYYNRQPTQLQQASYDAHYLMNLALSCSNSDNINENDDWDKFKSIIQCGISPNPCNIHGESFIHMVCQLCSSEVLQIMLDAGARIEISDDYGRTPLHFACQRLPPNFNIVQTIIENSSSNDVPLVQLFYMTDKRGSTPLDYVADHKHHWEEWNEFLSSKFNEWWGCYDDYFYSSNDDDDDIDLSTTRPNSCPIPDPHNALRPDLARMVVSNHILPEEAIDLNKGNKNYKINNNEKNIDIKDDECYYNENDDDDDSASDNSDFSDSSYYDSDDDSDDSMCVEDLQLLNDIHDTMSKRRVYGSGYSSTSNDTFNNSDGSFGITRHRQFVLSYTPQKEKTVGFLMKG